MDCEHETEPSEELNHMKKVLTALVLGSVLAASLAIAASTSFATLMPRPLHWLEISTVDQSLTVGNGDMICVRTTADFLPYVGISTDPQDDGALRWSEVKDERPGARTLACFDAIAPGDAKILITALLRNNGGRVDSTINVKVE